VWRYGLPGGHAAARRPARPRLPARPSLPARLAALALVLTAAGAAAIGTASQVIARGYLMRQASQELRGYVGQLTSAPFTLFPRSPVAPDAARQEAGALTVAVRDSAGRLLTSAGPAALATPAAGAPPVTIAVAGRRWLAIAAPIHYQTRHILFVYGAEDSSFSVTATATRGSQAGTLVAGLNLAGVDQAVGELTRTILAAAGLALLLVGCGTAWSARGILRRARDPAAGSRPAARGDPGRVLQSIAEAGRDLRRPLSILHGLAVNYRERGPLTSSEADRLMRRVADEAANAQAVVGRLTPAPPGEAPPS
jgi:hypothetical protein